MDYLYNFGIGKHILRTTDNFPITEYSEFLMSNFPNVKSKLVLDFGVGSGVLSIYSVLSGASKVFGLEVDNEAINVAKNNVRNNKMTNFIEIIKTQNFLLHYNEKVDIIICNPASLPTDKELPVFCDGGYYGMKMINQLFEITELYLSKFGAAYFLATSLVPYSCIDKLIIDYNFKINLIAKKEVKFRSFYSNIIPHLIKLKVLYDDVFFYEKNGEIYEEISLLEIKK